MDVLIPPINTMVMPNWERNQTYRAIGNAVRQSGGTYCFVHGLVVPDCGQCRGGVPDLSLFVFGGLHKKRDWEL